MWSSEHKQSKIHFEYSKPKRWWSGEQDMMQKEQSCECDLQKYIFSTDHGAALLLTQVTLRSCAMFINVTLTQLLVFHKLR